ncbi:MAG: ornithine carbamoyltransferase [Patescibacteria group bacterium]
MRHILSLKEITKEDITSLLDIAKVLKEHRRKERPTILLPNKTLIMFFEKSSTRTRLSFEAAMTELGGHAIFLDKKTTQFSLSDFQDEIRAVMRFGHALMYRAIAAESVETAASMNAIPVIDGCSEKYHPAQALSDLLTMAEAKGGIENVHKVVWLGIENNVSNTLALGCAKMGIKVVIVAPDADKGSIDPELEEQLQQTNNIERTLDISKALAAADFVHTDTWMNMEFFENGSVIKDKKEEFEKRKELFLPYQLNAKLIDTYCPDAHIMHCMPCHVDYEITRDAVEHKNSLIFDQAENRLHMQKAMLVWLMNKEKEVYSL